MPTSSESPAPIDRRALVRDAVRFSSLLGAVVCLAFVIAGAPSFAIGIGIGTLLGTINFVLLARGVGGAIDRTVAGIERTRTELEARGGRREADGEGFEPNDVLGRPQGAGAGLRLALSVLLVAALLLFLPTDPAGLAIGVVITLLGASLAAYRHNRAR